MPEYVFSKPAKDIDLSYIQWTLKSLLPEGAITGVSFNGSDIIIHSKNELTAKELQHIVTSLDKEPDPIKSHERAMSPDEFFKWLAEQYNINLRTAKDQIIVSIPKQDAPRR